jgi:hypothetical protein
MEILTGGRESYGLLYASYVYHYWHGGIVMDFGIIR